MSTGLNEILNGEPEAAEPAGAVETEVVEAEVETPEVETPAVTPEVETPKDSPPESEENIETLKGQIKAFEVKAADETRKRQHYQQQFEAAQKQAQTQEKPDAFAQPDEAIAHAIAGVEQRFQNQLLNMSEQGAKARHEDFEAMSELFFNKMAMENPALQAEALTQVDPYEFIYTSAKNQVELEQITELGGVDAMRESIREELRAELKAELETEKKAAIEKAIDGVIPNSLSGTRAAGGNQGETYSGPTPLSKIVGK